MAQGAAAPSVRQGSAPPTTAALTPRGLSRCRALSTSRRPQARAYTDTDQANLGLRLQVLRYYTLNTGVPYCDGQGPTSTDKKWAALRRQPGRITRTRRTLPQGRGPGRRHRPSRTTLATPGGDDKHTRALVSPALLVLLVLVYQWLRRELVPPVVVGRSALEWSLCST